MNLALVVRIVLAGPLAIVLTLLVLAAMPLWFPKGAAGIDHIVLPLILLPAIWAALFFHAVLDRSLWRVAAVAVGLAAVNGIMLARHLSTTVAGGS
jgi:hypothetical protein